MIGDEYESFIEAFLIAERVKLIDFLRIPREAKFIKEKINIPYSILVAILRILVSFGLLSRNKSTCVLNEGEYGELNSCNLNSSSANVDTLLNKLKQKDPKYFFDSLSDLEAEIYHSLDFDVSFEYGQRLAQCFDFTNRTLGDIGGSSGGLAAGIFSISKNAKITIYDTPIACTVGKRICKDNYLNLSFFPMDILKAKSLSKKFDYVLFSNVLHDWPDSIVFNLIMLGKNSLKKDGYIIIHEDILNDDRKSPLEAVVHGLELSINVPGGRQRTFSEFSTLLEKAGFENIFAMNQTGPFSILSANVQ